MEKKEIPVTGPNDQQDEILNQEETVLNAVEEIPVVEDAEILEELTSEIGDEKDAAVELVEAEEVAAENDDMKKKTDTEKMAAELAEMKDKYLRLYAEFDNYRKRTLREREDLFKTAAQDTIKSLISTLDDFERAIKVADADDNDESVSDGIRLIYEKLFRTLEQKGLKIMESTGQVFDVDLHEALTKIPAPTPEQKGMVIETIEKGYYLKDKIIRYAKVVVGA
jgi:molecular chaperone GrpE